MWDIITSIMWHLCIEHIIIQQIKNLYIMQSAKWDPGPNPTHQKAANLDPTYGQFWLYFFCVINHITRAAVIYYVRFSCQHQTSDRWTNWLPLTPGISKVMTALGDDEGDACVIASSSAAAAGLQVTVSQSLCDYVISSMHRLLILSNMPAWHFSVRKLLHIKATINSTKFVTIFLLYCTMTGNISAINRCNKHLELAENAVKKNLAGSNLKTDDIHNFIYSWCHTYMQCVHLHAIYRELVVLRYS